MLASSGRHNLKRRTAESLITSFFNASNGNKAMADAVTSAHAVIGDLRVQQIHDRTEALRLLESASSLREKVRQSETQEAFVYEQGRRQYAEELQADRQWEQVTA